MENQEYLIHYGVKGMKWGVRRYRNQDGSLTDAGRKRYGQMPNDKLAKELTKQVQRQRAQRHGASNRRMSGLDIGENSSKALKKRETDYKNFQNSETYKQGMKKYRELYRKYDSGEIDYEEYDEAFEKLESSINDPKFSASVRYTYAGKKYVDEYVNGYGKSITLGYIKDLGYSQEVAEEFVDRILKSNIKTIF